MGGILEGIAAILLVIFLPLYLFVLGGYGDLDVLIMLLYLQLLEKDKEISDLKSRLSDLNFKFESTQNYIADMKNKSRLEKNLTLHQILMRVLFFVAIAFFLVILISLVMS